jgi:hypothetical protein
MTDSSQALPQAQEPENGTWPHIREALRGLQFGHVTIIVQDGLVIQVERTEKKRLQRHKRNN